MRRTDGRLRLVSSPVSAQCWSRKRWTVLPYAGVRYLPNSLFFSHRNGVLVLTGGARSDSTALKKNTFIPICLSVRAALGSLYL